MLIIVILDILVRYYGCGIQTRDSSHQGEHADMVEFDA